MKMYKKVTLGFLSMLLTFSTLMPMAPKSEALSGSDFKAGNIISDSLFYNGNTMSSAQIQNFLNSKVPNCDTNHKKSSNPNDSGPPYTCLKNYAQNTPSRAANSNCKAYPGGSFKAARIIFEVGKACGISQKVLLVLLQKEQSLVTDTWPWQIQYRKATGYGCPDTSLPSNVDANNNGCYDAYEGFFNQVYYAAWQYKDYKNSPGDYSYRASRNNNIYWHPSGGDFLSKSTRNTKPCGYSSVFIKNNATAGLYNYTPYRPNSAALNNLYGTGNNCSAYGNRNFWRLYSDWFGSTHPSCTSSDRAGLNVYRLFSTKQGKHFYTAMECEANMFEVKTSYRIEGITFEQAPSTENGRTGVFRLKKKDKRYYFWTSSVKERDNLVKNHRYILEGTGYIGYKRTSTAPDKRPIYRLYNSKTGGHLWTPSENERNNVASKPSWRYEGIAYYVHKP